MIKNAYIHIPFCKSKCKYCSFVSFTDENQYLQDKYVESLIKEVNHYYKKDDLNTLYLGGGTPSLLTLKNLSKIISLFKFETNAEITFEANPDDLKKDYIKTIKSFGINRVSMGAQSFDDEILKQIGRRHSAKDIFESIELLQDSGIENISIDLIYGLPGQDIKKIEKDIAKITSLNIQHVSLYGLKIEEPSYFFYNLPENLPDEDMQADMYEIICEKLPKYGFMQYEISNFAKSGYESKHNLNYWNNNTYYGFGLSAHGYVDDIRYSNQFVFEDYFKNPLLHKEEKTLSLEEKLEEEIFLGFRKIAGIDLLSINKKYGIDFEEKYSTILSKYCPDYIVKSDFGYRLAQKGILLSNIILADFLH